jgi:hypothetical protein
MANTWRFKQQFAKEFHNYPQDQQDKILEFVELFELHGLADFTKYPGKITPSWSGLAATDPVCQYAKGHALWHYHIGIPKYSSNHSKYKTSDWVLHFQWPNKGDHVILVDVCYHYKSDGTFHIPDSRYLA